MGQKAITRGLQAVALAAIAAWGVAAAAQAQTTQGTTDGTAQDAAQGAAQSTTTMGQPATNGRDGVRIELNKLEQQGEACRAYLLFENEQGGEYPVYRLDLVLFDKQGRIDRRIAVDASPLRAGKSVVKLFDLSGLQCDGISKILLNDIAPCEDASGAREDCVVNARLSTLTDVSFYK